MATILNDGYCPECQLKGNETKLQLNKSDIWECPKTNLQMTSFGILATVLKFRGSGQFKNEIIYATSYINGAALSRAKDDTIFSDDSLINSDIELEDYLKNEVEPYVELSLQNLADSYAKKTHGNPFVAENSSAQYQRQSKYFKIDFKNEKILKSLEERDSKEEIPFSRSYKHLYSFLKLLFKKYYDVDASRLPDPGMSQTQFDLCKKHFPDSEQEVLKDPIIIKQRLLDFIVDVIEIIYLNRKPITNPWYEFNLKIDDHKQNSQFILKNEVSIINKFNVKNPGDTFKIHEEILPNPYIGRVETAPIVLLALNPGYDETEEVKGFYKKYHDWILDVTVHDYNKIEFPFFLLDKNYIADSDYWYKKLKPIHNGDAAKIATLAENICLIQYFPYTSKKFKDIRTSLIREEFEQDYLPSQLYNFWLVQKAIKRNAVIIMTRSKNYWFKAIPELENYHNLFFTNSYLNPTISEKNCPKGFLKIEEVLIKMAKNY